VTKGSWLNRSSLDRSLIMNEGYSSAAVGATAIVLHKLDVYSGEF
jgi:hypothetical protein